MSELFDFSGARQLDKNASTYLDTDSMAWRDGGVQGFWMKPLLRLESGVSTWLMKVDAGAFAPAHAHADQWEQIYVLSGSFYDQDKTVKPGDFICRPPGVEHTSGSQDGAVVLLVYSDAEPRVG